MEWQPIDLNNDAPAAGGYDVLIARTNGAVEVYAANTVRSLKRSAKENGETCVFTHWMPLPAPPSNAEVNGGRLADRPSEAV